MLSDQRPDEEIHNTFRKQREVVDVVFFYSKVCLFVLVKVFFFFTKVKQLRDYERKKHVLPEAKPYKHESGNKR